MHKHKNLNIFLNINRYIAKKIAYGLHILNQTLYIKEMAKIFKTLVCQPHLRDLLGLKMFALETSSHMWCSWKNPWNNISIDPCSSIQGTMS